MSADTHTPPLAARLAMLPPLPGTPRVSVLLAVRNEERFIARALDAVRSQEWDYERLEIIVADGASTDRTVAQVLRIAARDSRVRLVHNHAKFVAQGLNRALCEATGDVIVRVDGHCRIPGHYVKAGVAALRRDPSLACAGGPVRAQGGTAMADAIALAMSTPFGVGGASFRWARESRDVDHLPFGVWRREVFEMLGGFDEALVRNQDDEFSDRLHRAGGRIHMLHEQLVDYWSRSSLSALARQYLAYGFWKVRVIRMRGGWPSSPRHLVPAAFLLALAGGVAATLSTGIVALALVTPALYASFLFVAICALLARGHGRAALLLGAALPAMHMAYGAGFLAALVCTHPRAASHAPALAPRDAAHALQRAA